MKLFKSRKGKLSLLLMLAMLVQLIGPVMKGTSFADGKSGFIIKEISLTDPSGETPYDEGNPLKPDDEFLFKLEWELENGHDFEEGDTYELSLPGAINLTSSISDLELKDNFGLIVAIVDIDIDGQVTLTFTNFVNHASDISGFFAIRACLNRENIEVEEGKIEIEGINESGGLTIPLDFSEREKSISKIGEPNFKYEGNEIYWKVIVNLESKEFENVIIEDTFPAGTEYKADSLKVYKYKPFLGDNIDNLVGWDNGDGEITLDSDKLTIDDDKISLELGDINGPYIIEYTTSINETGEDLTSFENNVVFKDENTDDVTAKATVNITRGEPLDKGYKSFNPETGIMDWEIKFNYNKKNLEDITIKDIWTITGADDSIMVLLDESIEFKKMEIDENGQATAIDPEVIMYIDADQIVELENGFEITGITTNEPWLITYQTKIEDRLLDNISISNEVSFNDNTSTGDSPSLGQYYGKKEAENIDYSEKTIDWIITLNIDKRHMEDISVTDTLGKGLTLKNNDISGFEIKVGGAVYNDATFTDNGNDTFTIGFPEEFSTEKIITIKYTTSYDADQLEKEAEGEVTWLGAENKATIKWKAENSDDYIERDVTANTKLNQFTQDYSWKSAVYDPNSKEITWTIIANYRENIIGNLIVVDEPQGNQKYVENSIEVRKLTIDSSGTYSGPVLDTNEYTASVVDKEITVTLGATNSAYEITYKTSLKDLEKIDKEYENEVKIFDDEKPISELSSKVGVYGDKKYADKKGERKGKVIDWAIEVNIAQEKIYRLKLEDTITPNQEYIRDSIEVYEVVFVSDSTSDWGWRLEKGAELEEGSDKDYILTIYDANEEEEKGESFTIEWKGNEGIIEEAYIVEYSTLFYDLSFEDSQATVSNSYVISGEEKEIAEEDSDGESEVVIQESAFGGATGTSGRLIVHKKDRTYNTSIGELGDGGLPGVYFELYDTLSEKKIKSGTTDEYGILDFSRLLFGEYRLVETVPDGYVSISQETIININKEYSDVLADHTVEIENYKPYYGIELKKVDSVDTLQPLEGITFSITRKDDGTTESKITDDAGYIRFDDLAPGTYTVVETVTHEDYILHTFEYEITLKENRQLPYNLGMIPNTLIPGQAQLYKVDAENPDTGLVGAEFTIYKSDGTTEVRTVTSGENGLVNTGDLAPGNYIIKETKAPTGFEISEAAATGYEFEIKKYSQRGENKDDPINILTDDNKVTNEVRTTSIELTKQDGINKGQKIEGVTFKITGYQAPVDDIHASDYEDWFETYVENIPSMNTKTTGPDGKATFTGLKPGTYTFEESVADTNNYGYILNNDPITPITVKVTFNHVDNTTTVTRIVNNAPLANVILEKADSETRYKLAGAKFNVYKKEDSSYTGDYSDKEAVNSTPYTTNSSGSLSITGLIPGDYVIKEITAPTGYDLDSSIKEFTVPKAQELAPPNTTKKIEFTGEEAFKNDIKLGSVELKKIDGDSNEPIEGVEFKIQATSLVNDSSPSYLDEYNKKFKESDGTTDTTYTTGSNGLIKIEDLRPGTYKFTEVSTPDGYQPYREGDSYNEELEFTIGFPQSDTIATVESTIKNYKLVDIEIEKEWDDQNYLRPETVEIELLRDGAQFSPRKTIILNNENSWKGDFKGLDAVNSSGTKYRYSVRENNVPIGYAYTIEPTGYFEGGDENNKFTITNRAKTTSIQITKKDTISKALLAGAEFTLTYPDGITEIVGTTNGIGILIFNDLQPGEYKLQETEAPSGYYTDSIIYEITISLENVASSTIKTKEINNNPYAEVKLRKVDSDTRIPLEGAEFKVYKKIGDNYDFDTAIRTVTTDADGKISITGLAEGDYILQETKAPDGYDLLDNGIEFTVNSDGTETEFIDNENIGNQITLGSLKLRKIDGDSNEPIEDVEFKIQATSLVNDPGSSYLGDYNNQLSDETYKTNASGILEIEGLRPGDYTITEVYPSGYQEYNDLANNNFTITFDDTGKDVDLEDIKNYKLVDIGVEKIWKDDDIDHSSDEVEVELLRNGVATSNTDTLNDSNNWKAAFIGLDAIDPTTGIKYDYTVEEISIISDYESIISGDSSNGFTITNTASAKIDIGLKKEWNDNGNSEGIRPATVGIKLIRRVEGGTWGDVETVNLTSSTWEHTFTNLDKFDSEGKAYEYSVEEVNLDSSYKLESIKGDVDIGFTIRNVLLRDIEVKKVWNGGGTIKPNITIKLLRNGIEVDSHILVHPNLEHKWEGLEKYDVSGDEYEYTVKEVLPYNYRLEKIEGDMDNGYTITNRYSPYVPATIDITGMKIWKGLEEGQTPPTIELQLYRNGLAYMEPVSLEAGESSYTWMNLNLKDGEGNEYIYTVDEVEVPLGFTRSILSDGLTITNTWNPEKPDISKDVNDKKSYVLKGLDESFKYNIKVDMREGYKYKSLTISDKLDKVLELLGYKVYVNGKESKILTGLVEVHGQNIILDLEEGFDFSDFIGKTIHLQLEARIRKGANLSGYTNSPIPNQAKLSFNNEIEIFSEEVKVGPNGKTHILPATGTNTVRFILLYILGILSILSGYILIRKSREN